ncbi:MAG: 50S ribosomal protein L27 [Candidatus Gygaella obscura]|nr:50S ribosomal protein L27 [Candidatus Gygaella obscura]
MSAGVGGITKRFYRETRGLKVSGSQVVKKSTLLTRQGNRWLPGLNVSGKGGSLYALCEGEVYFTRRRGTYRRAKSYTYINIRPQEKSN